MEILIRLDFVFYMFATWLRIDSVSYFFVNISILYNYVPTRILLK